MPAHGQESIYYLAEASDPRSAIRAIESGNGLLTSESVQLQRSSGWFHFKLNGTRPDLLHLASTTLYGYEIFSIPAGTSLLRQGSSRDARDRPYWHPEFKIPLNPDWGDEFLLRIDFEPGGIVPFSFITEEEERSMMSGRMLGDGIYYGAIGLMAIFAFASSLFNRDDHAGRLSVCLAVWLLTVFASWGYGDLMLFPALPYLMATLGTPLVAVASLSSCWFCWHFLRESAAGSPFLFGLRLTMFAGLFYIFYAGFFGFTQTTVTSLMLATGFFAVATSVVSALRGDGAAKYLVAAAAFTVSPFILLLRSPPSQGVTIFIGMSALIMVALAILRRQGDRIRDNQLQAEVAKERGRFLASMSHEIRTPLNGIIGFSELCDEEQLQGEAKEYFDQINRSSRMLLSIVNDVLDYSKLEADEISLHSESMSVQKTLENVVTVVKPLAQTNRIDLSFSISDNVPEYVITDPHRCAQILINLCSNAVKFTQDGIVSIQVEREEKRLAFHVKDSGIGIDSKILEGLFDPFKQAEADTARQYGGTGLGLAISKQLAAMLDGELSAVSTIDVGSTFSLRIPFQEGTAPIATNAADKQFKVEGLNVLLAEDNDVNRMLATRILEKSGIQVDHAHNGKAAVLKATENVYDVILMDMQMPELSGTEATEQLRSLGCKSPVIAMTANTADSDRTACFDSGMNDYLAKPIAQGALLKKLELWSSGQTP